jgi:putative oxidoreductase
MKAPFLIGRALLGGFFLYNGINHLREYKKLAQYAGSKNVPAPQAGVIISGVALTVGGTSIVLGVKPKLGGRRLSAFWREFRH